jgi:hypothetical protein
VLGFVKSFYPCCEIYHAPKIKITYAPHICAASMLEVRKNMLSIHLKMFYSYTGGEHKNMFDMFEKFCCRNEIGGYVKEK